MNHKTPTYIRKRNLILNPNGSLHQKFKSISQAKRFSRIQQTDGRGMGQVAVDRSDDPKPPKLDFENLRSRGFVNRLIKDKPRRPVTIENFLERYKNSQEI